MNDATKPDGWAVFNFTHNYEGDEQAIMNTLNADGPLALPIGVTNGFHLYRSGIMDPTGAMCSTCTTNHGVLLVGHGTEDGKRFWIFKNRFISVLLSRTGSYQFSYQEQVHISSLIKNRFILVPLSRIGSYQFSYQEQVHISSLIKNRFISKLLSRTGSYRFLIHFYHFLNSMKQVVNLLS